VRQCSAEHHAHETVSRERRCRASADLTVPQDCDLGAEVRDILQFVRDEDCGRALGYQLPQRPEHQALLRSRDARSRFVQDNDARPEGEQANKFQLLALADCEAAD